MKEFSGEVTKRSVVAVIRIAHIPAGDITVYGSVPGTHTIFTNDHGFLHDQPVAVDLLGIHVRLSGQLRKAMGALIMNIVNSSVEMNV
jgi:hypothetical protein